MKDTDLTLDIALAKRLVAMCEETLDTTQDDIRVAFHLAVALDAISPGNDIAVELLQHAGRVRARGLAIILEKGLDRALHDVAQRRTKKSKGRKRK